MLTLSLSTTSVPTESVRAPSDTNISLVVKSVFFYLKFHRSLCHGFFFLMSTPCWNIVCQRRCFCCWFVDKCHMFSFPPSPFLSPPPVFKREKDTQPPPSMKVVSVFRLFLAAGLLLPVALVAFYVRYTSVHLARVNRKHLILLPSQER